MERFDIIGALVRRGCLEMIATKILERLSLVDLLRAQGKREREGTTVITVKRWLLTL